MTDAKSETDAATEQGEQPQLIPTTKLSFTGLNGEYAIEAKDALELGEQVRYTVTGYVKKVGTELLEPEDDSDNLRTRPFGQLKITGIRRTS